MSKKIRPKKKFVFVLQAAVLSALRRLSRRWPPYNEVLNRQKTEIFVPSKTGKPMRRVKFTCEICQASVGRKECAVDHISPVVDPDIGFVDYQTFIERLFCPVENLQILCENCHETKTKKENAKRRKTLPKAKKPAKLKTPSKRKK